MSRSEELKERSAIQAQLQTKLSDNASRVMGWIDSSKDTVKANTDSNGGTTVAFWSLPVVKTGSGLNFSEHAKESTDKITTVGQFITNCDSKLLGSLRDHMTRRNKQKSYHSMHKSSTSDSRAIQGLHRKIRSEKSRNTKKTLSISSKKSNDQRGMVNLLIGTEMHEEDSKPTIHKKVTTDLPFTSKNRF